MTIVNLSAIAIQVPNQTCALGVREPSDTTTTGEGNSLNEDHHSRSVVNVCVSGAFCEKVPAEVE